MVLSSFFGLVLIARPNFNFSVRRRIDACTLDSTYTYESFQRQRNRSQSQCLAFVFDDLLGNGDDDAWCCEDVWTALCCEGVLGVV